jgi:hypothetical protein
LLFSFVCLLFCSPLHLRNQQLNLSHSLTYLLTHSFIQSQFINLF